ncbi:hypothetical protein U728_728 [Clostridium botulinum 202F]|nr:hypothetical protein U728_728 [Clostridium botulinum 202F]MBY6987075.1 hypothetical protein [Clostridium botulinum]
MYKIFYSLITIIWILDILNIPRMEFLDTQIPINTLAWLLIWIFIPSTTVKVSKESEE